MNLETFLTDGRICKAWENPLMRIVKTRTYFFHSFPWQIFIEHLWPYLLLSGFYHPSHTDSDAVLGATWAPASLEESAPADLWAQNTRTHVPTWLASFLPPSLCSDPAFCTTANLTTRTHSKQLPSLALLHLFFSPWFFSTFNIPYMYFTVRIIYCLSSCSWGRTLGFAHHAPQAPEVPSGA